MISFLSVFVIIFSYALSMYGNCAVEKAFSHRLQYEMTRSMIHEFGKELEEALEKIDLNKEPR